MSKSKTTPSKSNKVACAECGYEDHILVRHIEKQHAMDAVTYLDKHPGAVLWSAVAFAKLHEHNAKATSPVASAPRPRRLVPINELFPQFATQLGVEISGEYPIFDTPGPLTPKLNPNYVFPPEETLDLMSILLKPERNRPYICGWSGTGKSDLVHNLAAICNAELIKWNADSYQDRDAQIGTMTAKDGETVWQDGIVPRALRRGVWLCVNELDLFDSRATNVLKPVLEDPPSVTLFENGGELVYGHPDFRAIATTNTWGRGDASGLFVNANVQSDADLRRWTARIKLDYMKPEVEVAMLRRYFPTAKDTYLMKFINVANKVRDAFKVGRIDKTFSPAELINWVENSFALGRDVHHSARVSFLNSLEPDVFTAISEMVRAEFGSTEGGAS